MEKNKIMMIVIISLLLVLIGTIVGLSVYAMRFLNKEAEEIPENTESVTVEQSEIQLITLPDPISTNLAKGNDTKEHVIRLKVSVAVNMSEKKESPVLLQLLTDRTIVIQDVIIGVLRNKTYEELSATNTQEILREEILTKLQQEFNTNLISTVYISELFLQ